MKYPARDPSGSFHSCCLKAYLIMSSCRRERESMVSLMSSLYEGGGRVTLASDDVSFTGLLPTSPIPSSPDAAL